MSQVLRSELGSQQTLYSDRIYLLPVFPPFPLIGAVLPTGSNCSCNATNSRCDDFGVCRCDPGWDGELCQRCVTMPGCVHGSCLQPWQCACQPGWGGRFCDKDLSVCSQQPCLNGATCLMEDSGDFRCLCPDGFHGPTCRKRKGPCLQRSGATCVDGVNRFSCLCPVGFSGRFCTVNMDDCASQPCRNGGRCLDRAGGFRCLCRPGFTGTTCETPPSPANASPMAAIWSPADRTGPISTRPRPGSGSGSGSLPSGL
uniref:Delta-like 2 homolog (Drosophila) n=1 Tax=Poecilia latipinna TaxID=48699 RepID=A0A3B3TT28_9TELE